MRGHLLKLGAFNIDIIIMVEHASYCSKCEFPFKEMGACPKPDVSMFWAYLSMVPYMIPIVIFFVILVTRKLKHVKTFSLLASCYVFGDKIIKNIIRSKSAFSKVQDLFWLARRVLECQVLIWQ